MFTGDSSPLDGESIGESQDAHEVIGLKEALQMLAESDEEDTEILKIIDTALMEPIPLLDDEEGWLAFRDKMKAIADFAKTLEGSTGRSRELREKIETRLAEVEQSS